MLKRNPQCFAEQCLSYSQKTRGLFNPSAGTHCSTLGLGNYKSVIGPAELLRFASAYKDFQAIADFERELRGLSRKDGYRL